ncbi:GMC family oxidoreductase N-terminal domain-containing protein [Candidatus Palauibacter sp.]|uniref:GMC family oxidoreductase N-terminal domain-containing protein n=1 Tax=Candidatus Palauibacter sp. TaxID=3101350 RepID=UPI003AF29406
MPYTFESLVGKSTAELDSIFLSGTAPKLEEVLRQEFQGWNVSKLSRLIRQQKFKKGFFGERDGGPEVSSSRAQLWGYNVTVKQDGLQARWQPLPCAEHPKRHLFFGVKQSVNVDGARYSNTLVIDYQLWNQQLFPKLALRLVDYLVCPNRNDPELVLGVSYWQWGVVAIRLSHFVLRRDTTPSTYRRRSGFLSHRPLRTVKAFAEAFLPANRRALLSTRPGAEEALSVTADDITWRIDRQLSQIRSKRTRSLTLLLYFIELWPICRTGRRFSRLSVDDRRRFLKQRFEGTTSRPLRDLARIRALFAGAYYGDARVWKSIRFQPITERSRYDSNAWEPQSQPPVNIRSDPGSIVETDVCVIGSGAAGSVVAGLLATKGRSVVMLEEGPYLAANDFDDDDEARTVARCYKEGGLQTTVDADLSIIQGQCVGGSTVINNKICFEIRDDVLDEWQRLGANLDRSVLRESFRRVRTTIEENALPDFRDKRVDDSNIKFLGKNAQLLLAGLKKRELTARHHGMFRKNKKDCLGCGYCNFGCRFGRQMTMLETYIPMLTGESAYIVDRCHADVLEKMGTRVSHVVCTRRDGSTMKVRAKSFVLACGAIGSSVLLMNSGVRVRHRGRDLVGSRFSFNVASLMFGKFGESIRGFDAMQMGSYTEAVEDESITSPYIIESYFSPPSSFAAGMPGGAKRHFARMLDYTHLSSAGVLIGDGSECKSEEDWIVARRARSSQMEQNREA